MVRVDILVDEQQTTRLETKSDTIAFLRGLGFIGSGPRSPQPGAPYTYVTTDAFLGHFGLNTLRDLPDLETLEDGGLLSKAKLMGGSEGEEFPLSVDDNESDDSADDE